MYEDSDPSGASYNEYLKNMDRIAKQEQELRTVKVQGQINFNQLDRAGDMISPKALLNSRIGTPVSLNFDTGKIIGVMTNYTITDEHIIFDIDIFDEEVKKAVSENILRNVSIGGRIIKSSDVRYNGDTGKPLEENYKMIDEFELMEVAVVELPFHKDWKIIKKEEKKE